MKFVFGASSHLVFYLCNKYIEEHHLPYDDCIFFLTRNYHEPEGYSDRYTHFIRTDYNLAGSSQGRIFAGWKVWETIRNRREFDALVDSYIGNDDYIYYTQVCNNELCSLMVTKKNCIGYYVIEDGSGSYRQENPQTFVGWKYYVYRWLLKPLFPRFYTVKNHFIETNHPKFKGCIATSSDCFPLHQAYLEVVGVPFDTIDLGYEPDAVISIDPLYLFVDEAAAYQLFDKMSRFVMQQGYRVIVYKYHPNFYSPSMAKMKQAYESMLRKCFGDTIRELPATICLENVLNTYHSDFYTGFSSICIYAYEMGAKCYSNYPHLRKFVPNFKLPSIFMDRCIMLEEDYSS